MEMMAVRHEFRLIPTSALKPHEEVDESRVLDLAERFQAEGFVFQPVVADERTLTVIDGHHRLAALKRLGASHAPAYLVDYADPAITVESWRVNEKPPSKAEITQRALAGELFPIKTTRHPSIYGLRDRRTALADLR